MEAHSLHIAVDITNPDHYGESMLLSCGKIDAALMGGRANKSKAYKSTTYLLDQAATKNNVTRALSEFARLTQQNPQEVYYFYISATCHGFSYEESRHGGEDGHLEFLCLYDQMILEHELREMLTWFDKNAIIFFVLGSCYAGGIFSEDLSKALPTDGEPDVIRINRKHYEALIKRHYGSIHSYKAQGITLSASPKDGTASEAGSREPSLFTGK